jgi:probable HAF family extracellular repeat protein
VDIISRWRLWCIKVLRIGICTACSHALVAGAVDPMYRITEIGERTDGVEYGNGGKQLSASGQVTGYAVNSRMPFHAFIWQPSGSSLVDLGPFDSTGAAYGQSMGNAINASGQITGYAYPDGPTYAFLWRNDGTPMLYLGTFGGSSSEGLDINESGQIVGDAQIAGDAGNHAFIWKNDGHPIQDLGTLGGRSSEAKAINASGQVTGIANTRGNAAIHAFFWKNDGTKMVDLGTLGGVNSDGQFINSSGQVIGVSDLPGQTAHHGFLWRNDGTPMVDLGTLGGPYSTPSAINDSGLITGSAYLRARAVSSRAVVWTNGGTQIHNLGTLGGTTSTGNDINNSGWVVGWSLTTKSSAYNSGDAFLWKNDGRPIRDLNDLVDPADSLKPYVKLVSGLAINDAGDIVARGTDSRDGNYVNHEYFLRGSNLALNPRALAFGNQKVGTTSATKSVTVQNVSSSVVPIASIALAGAAAGQFLSTNTCGSSVVAKGSCTIKVTFKPTSKGAKTATLSVNGSGGGLRVVNLSGTGI